MNGKAHSFVFCNWLVMSSMEKMIRRIFLEAGLSNLQKNQEIMLKSIRRRYLHGILGVKKLLLFFIFNNFLLYS